MNEGDIDSALNIWTQELDVRRAVYGAGHYLTADVLNRVGVIRLEKDEFELVSDYTINIYALTFMLFRIATLRAIVYISFSHKSTNFLLMMLYSRLAGQRLSHPGFGDTTGLPR